MQPDMFLSVPLHGQATAAVQAKPAVVTADANFGDVFARLQNEGRVTTPEVAGGQDHARLNGISVAEEREETGKPEEAEDDAVRFTETDDVDSRPNRSKLERPPKRAQVSDSDEALRDQEIQFVTVRPASGEKEAEQRLAELAVPALFDSEAVLASRVRSSVPDDSWRVEEGSQPGCNVRREYPDEIAPEGLKTGDFRDDAGPSMHKRVPVEVTSGLVSGSIAIEGPDDPETVPLDPKPADIGTETGRWLSESRDSRVRTPARTDTSLVLNTGRRNPDFHQSDRTLPVSGPEKILLNRAIEPQTPLFDLTEGVPDSRNLHEISALAAVSWTRAVSEGGKTGHVAAREAGQAARVHRLPETPSLSSNHAGDYRHGHGVISPEENQMVGQAETEGLPDGGPEQQRLDATAPIAASNSTITAHIGQAHMEPKALSPDTETNHADGFRWQIVGKRGAKVQKVPANSGEGAAAGQLAPVARSQLPVEKEAIDGDHDLVSARENSRTTRSGTSAALTSITPAEEKSPDSGNFLPPHAHRPLPDVRDPAGAPWTENERVKSEWAKGATVASNGMQGPVAPIPGSRSTMEPLPTRAVPGSGVEHSAKPGWSETVDRRPLEEPSVPRRSDVDSAYRPPAHDTAKLPTAHEGMPFVDTQVAKLGIPDMDSPLPVGVSEMPVPLTREGSGQISGTSANPAQYAAMARDVAQQLSVVTRVAPGEVTELSLRPEELGHVRMRLAASEGQIMLQILSERPETHDLMRRHIDIVERAFRDLGFRDIAFDFSFSGQRDGSGQEKVDPSGLEEAVANDTPLAPETTQRRLALSGRLDIRL